MSEFEMSGQTYRVDKVNAFVQLDVARRLMPLQIAMGLSSQKVAQTLAADEAAVLEYLGAPIAQVVSRMPQDDFQFITYTAARAASRKQGDRFAPVMVGDALMFNDLNMQVLLRIAIEFVKENLGGFFEGLGGALLSPGTSSDQVPTSPQ